MMEQEYTNLITELDHVLSSIRTVWMEAKTPEEKAKWHVRLDELLDERMRLMKARDASSKL